MTDKLLLMKVEGIGGMKAERLLTHFGSGSDVARAACNGWGQITNVEGFTDDTARDLFHKMKAAGVFHDLRGY